jgi:hypothetical protein
MTCSCRAFSPHKLRTGRFCLVLLSALAGIALTAALLTDASELSAATRLKATADGSCQPDVVQPNGSIYRFCLPPGWDGKGLLVYAHGYIWFNEPLTIPHRHICFGEAINETCINDVVNDLGVAFATTSYPTNGLAVLPAVDDVANLVRVFSDTYGSPETTLIAGVSEGGLVTTLAMERLPHVFDGGLAACGPIGSWVEQINFLGDFRVLFDYFFPNLLPSDVITIPNWLIDQWTNHDYFANVVEPVIFNPANAFSLTQLLTTSSLPYMPSVTHTIWTAVRDAMAYNVMATNNAMEKLGGNPFDNIGRVYSGSADDVALNAGVRRFSADPAALAEMQKYETSGWLTRPLVTLHTSRDQQVPQWHESLYRQKVLAIHSWMWHIDQPVPVDGYGHCNFDPTEEVMPAVFALLDLVADPPQPSLQYLPIVLR